MKELRTDVLIPRFFNPDMSRNRARIPQPLVTVTLDEIESEFGGYTMNDIPIVGSWIDPKTKVSVKDTHTSIWIASQKTPAVVKRLEELKRILEKRFQQEVITMYQITIERL